MKTLPILFLLAACQLTTEQEQAQLLRDLDRAAGIIERTGNADAAAAAALAREIIARVQNDAEAGVVLATIEALRARIPDLRAELVEKWGQVEAEVALGLLESALDRLAAGLEGA